MARFLADDWIADLAARAAQVTIEDDIHLTIEQRIDGEPDATWHVEVTEGQLRVRRGAHPDAAVWLTTSRPIAAAIHEGELSAQRAFLDGDLRIGGDIRALLAARAALDAVAGLLATT